MGEAMAIRKYATFTLRKGSALVVGRRKTTGADPRLWGHEPEPGMLYVTCAAISSRVNANYDAWPPDELRKSYKTFIGRGVFVDHNNWDHERSRGVILDARIYEEKLASGHEDVWVELLIEVDAQAFPKLADAILNGDVDAVSMGADIEISECSVCANKASDPMNYCAHIPNLKGQYIQTTDKKTGSLKKVLCFEKCYGVNFFEISFVFDPADESADILDKFMYEGRSSRKVARHIRRVGETVPQYHKRVNGISKAASRAAQRMPGLPDTCVAKGCSQNTKHRWQGNHLCTKHYQEAKDKFGSKPNFTHTHQTTTSNSSAHSWTNQTTGDKVVMSLPGEFNIQEEQTVCPDCGAQWDGITCESCGFEVPPPSLDDPNTEEAALVAEEQEAEEEGLDEDTEEEEGAVVAGRWREGAGPYFDSTKWDEDGDEYWQHSTEIAGPPSGESASREFIEENYHQYREEEFGGASEAEEIELGEALDYMERPKKKKKRKRNENPSSADWAGAMDRWTKRKKKGGPMGRFERVAYPRRRKAQHNPIPNHDVGTQLEQVPAPANAVGPYGTSPTITPVPPPEPPVSTSDAEAIKQDNSDPRALDAPDVVGPPGQSEVNAGIARAVARRRRRGYLKRAEMLREQANWFRRKADEVFKEDVQNLDAPTPVNVGPDARVDVEAPTDEGPQLQLADTPDDINDGTETGLPYADEAPQPVNPMQNVGPYAPPQEMQARRRQKKSAEQCQWFDEQEDGSTIECKRPAVNGLNCQTHAAETERIEKENREASYGSRRQAAQQRQHFQNKIAQEKTKTLRVANFVDERIALGLTNPEEKLAEVAKFEAMTNQELQGYIKATKEFKRQSQKRTSSKRVRVAGSGGSRLPSLGAASRPRRGGGADSSDDSLIFMN